MVWAGISWRRKTPVVFVNSKLNAEEYVNMLENKYMLWVVNAYTFGHIFQKDGAPAHTAKHTMENNEMITVAGCGSRTWPLLEQR